MPRKKISIEEAFKVLEEAGIPIQVRPTIPATQPVVEMKSRKGQIFDTSPKVTPSKKYMEVTLYAKHSVGSGGSMVVKEGEKQVENAGVQSYGPGRFTVPIELASHLLYADAQARRADDNMLSKEQKSYLVVARIGGDGQRVNVGVQVDNSLFDDIGSVPNNLSYRI